MDKPIIFTMEHCPECEALKLWAKDRGIEIEERPARTVFDHEKALELSEVLERQRMAFPLVWWNGEAMSGGAFRILAMRLESKNK